MALAVQQPELPESWDHFPLKRKKKKRQEGMILELFTKAAFDNMNAKVQKFHLYIYS